MKKEIVGAVSAALIAFFAATGVLAGDWSGPYVGFGVGRADVDGPGAIAGDDTSFGIHAGYGWDFGDWVLGGELEYDRANIGLNAASVEVDSIARVKVRGGYDFGATMAYGVLGAARLETTVGDDSGYVYGLGVAYQINDKFDVSGELLRHEFNNLAGSGADYDADSFNIRASFRF